MTSPLNTLFLFLSLATFCFLSSHAVISFPKFPPPHLIQSAAEYTIQDLFHLEVWPREKAEWSQCLLGNCTRDHVTNIFLVDLIGGMDDPCFLAKNLDNRCFDQERAGDILSIWDGESVGNSEGDTLDFNIPALLDFLYNADNCGAKLSSALEEFECFLTKQYNLDTFEPVLIRVVEHSDPSSLSTSCNPTSCGPAGKIRTVVNIVVPDLCGSDCVGEPLNVLPIGEKQLDWLLYRNELLAARERIQELKAKVMSEKVENNACAETLRLGGEPCELPYEHLVEVHQDLVEECLADWEEVLALDSVFPSSA